LLVIIILGGLCLISVDRLKVDDKACLGVRVELPGSPPLVLIVVEKAS